MTATTKTAKTGVARRADKPKASDAVKRENRTGWAFMAPFGIMFALVFILPIIWAIYSSFFRQVTTGGGAYGGGELVDKFVGLQNFQYVITSGNFWAGVGRVVLYTVIQVPVMIIAALALAMLIDSYIVKHITAFRLSYFLPYAIPGVVASIIWVYLYNGQISPIVKGLAAIGIKVNFFGDNVVLGSMANITTWTFTGYNMLIFLAALQAIPQVMSISDPSISKSYTPMMMALNTSQGTLTPGGDGPASAVAIVMALIAGVLAVVYTLVERKVNAE